MAQVNFTAGEFAEWMRRYRPLSDPYPLYERMQEAETHREVYRALEEVAHTADLMGVESIAVPEGEQNPDQAMSYVNAGDTYDVTVLYDEGTSTFMLTSWGAWLERAEQALHEAGVPANADEDVCGTCGRVWPMDEMVVDVNPDTGVHEGTCHRCLREREEQGERPPTWTPRADQPLIAMLRSVEGFLVAVHLYEPTREIVDPPERPNQPWASVRIRVVDDPVIAFSAVVRGSTNSPYDEAFIARETSGRRDSGTPYLEAWSELVDRSRKGDQLFVASTNPSPPYGTNRDVSIESEAVSRLRVAMDAFFGVGMEYQPLKKVLETPPVLFTCDEVNEIQWLTDDWGRHRDGIQAFVRREEEVGSTIQSSDLVVWSASAEEAAELVEDGFIKWGDDRTMREYLQQIGVCRAR